MAVELAAAVSHEVLRVTEILCTGATFVLQLADVHLEIVDSADVGFHLDAILAQDVFGGIVGTEAALETAQILGQDEQIRLDELNGRLRRLGQEVLNRVLGC